MSIAGAFRHEQAARHRMRFYHAAACVLEFAVLLVHQAALQCIAEHRIHAVMPCHAKYTESSGMQAAKDGPAQPGRIDTAICHASISLSELQQHRLPELLGGLPQLVHALDVSTGRLVHKCAALRCACGCSRSRSGGDGPAAAGAEAMDADE